MSRFDYKDVYIEDGKRILEINILPEKYCNFDCIFCPIGHSQNKVDTQKTFDLTDETLTELADKIKTLNPDLVFINSKGEAFVNNQLDMIIEFIKNTNTPVRLLSNGYLLGRSEYLKIANKCDEVVGELKLITEEDFQKIQRPIQGYTLSEYITNMCTFNKQYNGTFIFEVTIIKEFNDSVESLHKIKNIIKQIAPTKTIVARLEEERFQKKLGITDDRFKEISHFLLTTI